MTDERQMQHGPPGRSSHGAVRRRLFALVGGVGLFVVFSSPAVAGPWYGKPTIASTQASFKVPRASTTSWTLRLWSHGALEGSATGTSGTLVVVVPVTADCAFQADVTATPLGGRPYFYSGARATLAHCGVTPPTQTVAGHIYQCTPAGAPTTTEIPGGTLTATGPQTVASTANPLAPTSVSSGTYSMTAASPTGYLLVACGGTATVGSNGLTASESVTAPPGGAGVGLFYVSAAPPFGAGGGSAGSTPTSSSGGANGVPTPTRVASAAARSAPVRAVSVAASHLAFTGMDTGPPLVLGLVLLGLGLLLIAGARPRRSAGRHVITVPVPENARRWKTPRRGPSA